MLHTLLCSPTLNCCLSWTPLVLHKKCDLDYQCRSRARHFLWKVSILPSFFSKTCLQLSLNLVGQFLGRSITGASLQLSSTKPNLSFKQRINKWKEKERKRTVWPETIEGKIDASHTLNPSTPYTFNLESTTPPWSKGAIRHVEVGWYTVSTRSRTISSNSASDLRWRWWSRSGSSHSWSSNELIGSCCATLWQRRMPRTILARSSWVEM